MNAYAAYRQRQAHFAPKELLVSLYLGDSEQLDPSEGEYEMDVVGKVKINPPEPSTNFAGDWEVWEDFEPVAVYRNGVKLTAFDKERFAGLIDNDDLYEAIEAKLGEQQN